jgi:tripartite-type tricarboxylate transporter receptor subunit TctC
MLKNLVVGIMLAVVGISACAENIKILVPYAPGGIGDASVRVIAKQLNEAIPEHRFVPETIAGAGGAIAAQKLANTTGKETVLMLHSLNVVMHSIKSGARYTMHDFQPVVHVGAIPMFLVVKSDGPVNTLPKFLNSAEFYGSSGVGAGNAIAMVMLQQATGKNMVHVPYKGEIPALTDIAGGNVDSAFSSLSGAKAFLDSGKLVALGVTGSKRHPAMPLVPTFKEQGIDGVSGPINWLIVFANNSADPKLIKQVQVALNNAINKNPEVYQQLGYITHGRYKNNLQQFTTSEAIKLYQLLPALEPRK